MTNPNIAEAGKNTQFSSENQPENKGRKKNVFKHLKGLYEVSAEDVSSIVQYLLSLTLEELQEIIKDKQTKTLVVVYASAVYNSIKSGKTDQLETMLNRSIGKPADNVNLLSELPVTINVNGVRPGHTGEDTSGNNEPEEI